MNYRGFEIRPVSRNLRGLTVRGYGIYLNDNLLTVAENTLIAKRHIDDRVKRGIWKEAKTDE